MVNTTAASCWVLTLQRIPTGCLSSLFLCCFPLLLCPSFLQFYVFLTLSASLRQMAATQWPGFTDQGFWLIHDLTQTAVVLGEKSWYLMHAPYSFAGFLLPFALLWMYRETTQKSPVGRWGKSSPPCRKGRLQRSSS